MALWGGTRALAAGFAIVLLAAAGAAAWRANSHVEVDHEALRKARLMEDVMFGRAALGGPFSLTDHHGRRRSLAEWRGKIVVLYFGYMFCPDVCPTDLVAIASMMTALGPESAHVVPLFVTLDPERDTIEQLRLYVPHFHSRLIGLTGTPEEVAKVAALYKIYFKKVAAREGPHYLLEHSAYIYVLDEHGQHYETFPAGTSPQRLTTLLRDLVRRMTAAS